MEVNDGELGVSAAISLGEEPPTPIRQEKGWGGPRAGLDTVVKRIISAYP
jgi:hypothetical protein